MLFDRQQDACLSFSFDGNGYRGFGWGVEKAAEEISLPVAKKFKINEIMTTLFGHAGVQASSDQWWAWCVYANGIQFDKAFHDWQNNPKPWQAMLDGSLATTMVDIAVKVHDAFKDRMDLLMPTTTAPVASMAPGDSVDVGAIPNLSAQGNVGITG
jgi:hypothetical protein